MISLTTELFETLAIQQLAITDDALTVDLSDGRTLSVPLAWYPRLQHGSTEERNDYRFIAGGNGIHWNQLDEDISVKNLILGQPSGESQKSFQRWLNNREVIV
jgi:fructose-1-phosphate kinase PfkB-like protein